MKVLIKLNKDRAFIEKAMEIDEEVIVDVNPEDFTKEEREQLLNCKKEFSVKSDRKDVYKLNGIDSFNNDDYFAQAYNEARKGSQWLDIIEPTTENIKMILAERKKIIKKMAEFKRQYEESQKQRDRDYVDEILEKPTRELCSIIISRKSGDYIGSFKYSEEFKRAKKFSEDLKYKESLIEEKEKEIEKDAIDCINIDIEAQKRDDIERTKETLALEGYFISVINESASSNQKERYEEGLLPERELTDLVNKDIFKDLYSDMIKNLDFEYDYLNKMSAESFDKMKEIKNYLTSNLSEKFDTTTISINFDETEDDPYPEEDVPAVKVDVYKHGKTFTGYFKV